MDFNRVCDEIEKEGLSVQTDALTPGLLKQLISDHANFARKGLLTQANIGKGQARETRKEIRNNLSLWLNESDPTPAQSAWWQELEELRAALNQRFYLGLNRLEAHYTSYPPGGFYHRHLDASGSEPGRRISLVLYLNETWIPEHGGELRIYHGDSYTDVAPKAGTLVCFLSRELEHEVRLNHAPRASFTGWFRN